MEPGDLFAGRQLIDLEAERLRLEGYLDRLGPTAQPDLLARMQARLEQVCGEIVREA